VPRKLSPDNGGKQGVIAGAGLCLCPAWHYKKSPTNIPTSELKRGWHGGFTLIKEPAARRLANLICYTLSSVFPRPWQKGGSGKLEGGGPLTCETSIENATQ